MIQRMMVYKKRSEYACIEEIINRTDSHSKGVSEATNRVGELVTQLDIVVVEPASRNLSDAIEASDAGLGKEGSEEVANNSTNTVSSKDLCTQVRHRFAFRLKVTYIKGIIITEEELELGSKIAKGTAKDTEENSGS